MRVNVDKPLQPQAFSEWLDAFRWVAATMVLLSHAGGQLLIRLGLLPDEQRTLPYFGYSFFAGFAHHAVMIFFVMSGFLVGGSLVREMTRGAPSLGIYTLKRVVRLSIVLLPTLLLTLVMAQVGAAIYPDGVAGPYDQKVMGSLDLGTFACNSIFMQNALCTRYGGNDSLWSLFHEFWYYMAFPLIALAVYVKKPQLKAVAVISCAALLLALALLQRTNAYIIPYFLIWIMGVGIAVAPRRLAASPLLPAGILLVLLPLLRVVGGRDLWSGTTIPGFAADLSVAVVFTYLLICMKWSAQLVRPPLARLHVKLASFSFTLYCTHVPVIMLYCAICMRMFGVGYDMIPLRIEHWMIVAGGLATCFAFAYALSLLTEAHTDRVRMFILGVLGAKKSLAEKPGVV